MKKIFVYAAILLAVSLPAQEKASKYVTGGFGHFYQGPCYYAPSALLDYLGKTEVMNTTLQHRMGTMAGGEGAALLGDFMIGGGGFAETALRTITDSARTQLYVNGGYFRFGYVFANCNSNLAYAYGGIGWGSLSVHFDNFTKESGIAFDKNHALTPGRREDYRLDMNFYDFGLSFKHVFDKRENAHGGFMVGLDLGTFITQATSEWSNEADDLVFGPPVPRMAFNPYLRITIGGGGFNE